MKAFGALSGGKWEPVTVTDSIETGKVVLSRLDGTVVSVSPDGQVLVRPAGTDAAWERGVISGHLITYPTDGVNCYGFALTDL